MRTKLSLLASASLVSLALGMNSGALAADLPTVAPEPLPEPARTISASVGLYAAFSWLDASYSDCEDSCGPEEDNPWGLGGEAFVDIPFNENWGLQLDQYGEFLSGKREDMTSTEDHLGGWFTAAHLNYREMNRYLLGVYGGFGMTWGGSSTTDSPYHQWVLGIEGQYYWNNTTFYAQLGIADTDPPGTTGGSTDNQIEESWFIRGEVRHYFNQGNTKIAGELGYQAGKNDHNSTNDDVNAVWWAAEIEHAFKNWGNDGFLAGYARYEGYHFDEKSSGGGDQATAHILMVGLRMDLNHINPFERERYGVAVDVHNVSRLHGHSRLVEADDAD